MIADIDHNKCNVFIDYFTSVFTKENEFNKIIYHLNLVILSCLILLSKGMMCAKN